MTSVQRITSGAPWENKVGYRRAVRSGNFVAVAGTVAVDADGKPFAPGDVGAQTTRALQVIVAALKEAGASVEDVVRTRVYTLDMSAQTQAAVGAAHLAVFKDCPPASTMLAVKAFADPAFLVEIEADAVIP